jgi:hypothetical protein
MNLGYLQKGISIKLRKIIIFSWHLEGRRRKAQDLELDPCPDPLDKGRYGSEDPHPDPYQNFMDPEH